MARTLKNVENETQTL